MVCFIPGEMWIGYFLKSELWIYTFCGLVNSCFNSWFLVKVAYLRCSNLFWWLVNWLIISPKFENVGGIMFLVPPPPPPPSPPPSLPPHANACTGHYFVTNAPIKFIFAIAIEVPDYKNLMIFGINRKNWRPFCIKMLKKLVASLTVS